MKGLEIFFPPFDTIVCDPELEKHFVDHKIEPGRYMMGNYIVIVEKCMPENSALFLDKDKNIVAIYLSGRLSFNEAKIKKLEVVFEWEKYKDRLFKGE